MAHFEIKANMGGVVDQINPLLQCAHDWPEAMKDRFAREWREKEAAGLEMLEFGEIKDGVGKFNLTVQISAAFRDHCAAYGVHLN